MAATKKTDNHFTADKMALRIKYSCWGEKPLRVLDVFGGHGVIWRGVERKSGRKVLRTAIDSRDDLKTFHLHGDNSKVMASLDLSEFDVIDLDAYGIPSEQLQIIFDKKYSGIVFVTAIQTMQGQMPKRILEDIGIPSEISTKCPTLASKRGWDYLKEWLSKNGVKKIIHRSWSRKHYFVFAVNGAVLPSAGCDSHRGGISANPS